MYLQYVSDDAIIRFVNLVNMHTTDATIRRDSNDKNSAFVFSTLAPATISITDFECIDIQNNRIYSRMFRKFMLEELDKIDKDLGDKYIDCLHAYLERDTAYGPVI